MSFQHTNSTCNPYKYQWQAILPIQFSGNSFLQVKMPNMPTNLPTYIYSVCIQKDTETEKMIYYYRDSSTEPDSKQGSYLEPTQ